MLLEKDGLVFGPRSPADGKVGLIYHCALSSPFALMQTYAVWEPYREPFHFHSF